MSHELKETGSGVLWKSEFDEEVKSDTTIASDEPSGEPIYINPSLDEFKNIAIKDNQFDASLEIIGTKQRKVEFENKEAQSISDAEDIATVEEIFGFYAPPIQQREFVGPIQSYAQVKERPSKSNSVLITLSKNKISLEDFYVVNITPTRAIDDDFPEESWEVTEGYDILKMLNPQPQVPMKVSARTDLRQIFSKLVPDRNYKAFDTDAICSEFLSLESAARSIVKDIILSATRETRRRVSEYGTRKPPYKDIIQYQKLHSHWPSIKNFSKDLGKMYISEYIDKKNYFFEDWKYNVVFDREHSDNLSDHYVYEVKFGLPTKMYPIPQVTASIFFFMEASRVLPSQCPIKVTLSLETSRRRMDPQKFLLRDNLLLKILDEKIMNLKIIDF